MALNLAAAGFLPPADYLSDIDFMKAVNDNDWLVFSQEDIDAFSRDISVLENKASVEGLSPEERDWLEKAARDRSKLVLKEIVDKNGKRTKKWVKVKEHSPEKLKELKASHEIETKLVNGINVRIVKKPVNARAKSIYVWNIDLYDGDSATPFDSFALGKYQSLDGTVENSVRSYRHKKAVAEREEKEAKLDTGTNSSIVAVAREYQILVEKYNAGDESVIKELNRAERYLDLPITQPNKEKSPKADEDKSGGSTMERERRKLFSQSDIDGSLGRAPMDSVERAMTKYGDEWVLGDDYSDDAMADTFQRLEKLPIWREAEKTGAPDAFFMETDAGMKIFEPMYREELAKAQVRQMRKVAVSGNKKMMDGTALTKKEMTAALMQHGDLLLGKKFDEFQTKVYSTAVSKMERLYPAIVKEYSGAVDVALHETNEGNKVLASSYDNWTTDVYKDYLSGKYKLPYTEEEIKKYTK